LKTRIIQKAGVPAVALAALILMVGCSSGKAAKEPVATVNGTPISMIDVREALGIPAGVIAASGVPAAKKKEALNQVIETRLLALDARAHGFDNTAEFRDALKQNEKGIWITGLLRKAFESKTKDAKTENAIKEETGKLKASDKKLTEADARMRAVQVVFDGILRNLQNDLLGSAKKEFPYTVNQSTVSLVSKGESVADNAPLASGGADIVTYGDIKGLLKASAEGAAKAGKGPSTDVMALTNALDREMQTRSLYAYAKKQEIDKGQSFASVRQGLEQSLLITMLLDKVVLKTITVSDREIAETYDGHKDMFIQGGKALPLAQVKDQIKGFLENEKRRKTVEAYVADLKPKAKITINEAILSKV
jgi:hypothetical protein